MDVYATSTDEVTVHYRARTRDGGVIEDTINRKPLTFHLDDDRYLPMFRRHIEGMRPGESKTVLLEPESGFGQREFKQQITVPRECLPSGCDQGDQLVSELHGEQVNVWVVQLNKDEATLDTNHPLAGESLELTIQLVSVQN